MNDNPLADYLDEVNVAFDVMFDPDFDHALLGLDLELTNYAPPGYEPFDTEELVARGSVTGRKVA